jgi:hypothetical protein
MEKNGVIFRGVEYIDVFLNIYWFRRYEGTVPAARRAFVHYMLKFMFLREETKVRTIIAGPGNRTIT